MAGFYMKRSTGQKWVKRLVKKFPNKSEHWTVKDFTGATHDFKQIK